MLAELEDKITTLDAEINELTKQKKTEMDELRLSQLSRNKEELLASYKIFTPQDKVFLSRHEVRPTTRDYIQALFEDFFECRGDRLFGEDASILGGVAKFKGIPVTLIGHQKGRNTEENIAHRFGMPNPEGYRKAHRLMEQAEKFGRPIITFIDTPGAYPGIDAEMRGQSTAIAENLSLMSRLEVPIIVIVTGEGGSGGALAIGVGNKVFMLEHAIYSILSPEGFATILWKDGSRSGEASNLMKLTAQDLYADGIIEGIIPEPLGGAHHDFSATCDAIQQVLVESLIELIPLKGKKLAAMRYEKFRQIGNIVAKKSNKNEKE